MRGLIKLLGIAAIVALTFTACNKEDASLGLAEEATPTQELTLADILAPPNQTGPVIGFRSRKTPAIWGDCAPFGTILTSTNFKPSAGNFDKLYNGAVFKDGLGAISESKPGDRDYNGGRWNVFSLKAGVDMYKYQDVCRVEELDLNDFEHAGIYFECPMRPIR